MKAFKCAIAAVSLASLTLASCGDDSARQISAPSPSPTPSTIAAKSDISIVAQRAGATPFISFVDLSGTSTAALAEVGYTIDPMPGTASKPVGVTFTIVSLQNRGRISGNTVTVPVFGLYANRTNSATLKLKFTDGSVQPLQTMITTRAYDVASPFSTPTLNMTRQAGSALGFDYFLMKPNNPRAPVTIIDSDGNIRWASTTLAGASVLFRDNGVDIADTTKAALYREELDGTTSSVTINNPSYQQFHHDLSLGRSGILAAPNVVGRQEDFLIELAPNGDEIKTWDLADIFETYMRSQGDDPSNFVRRGVDWFHLNSAIYDPRDGTIIVSSRENFIVKLDYDSGAIEWILGDPTKYWYTFRSLRAKSLTISPGGLVPVGQHALSIAPDGELVMFNNGYGSLNMPAGTPSGEARNYSAVTGFAIDPNAKTASQRFTFDDNRNVYSSICSSAYFSPDGSLLISYSQAEGGTVLRMKGLNPQRQVVFDYSYPTRFGCVSSWNAVIVPFDNLRFTS